MSTTLFVGAHLATDFGGMEVESVKAGPDNRNYARLHFTGRDKRYDVEVDEHGAIVDEPAFLGALMREWERVGPVGIGNSAYDAPVTRVEHPPGFAVLGVFDGGGALLVKYTGEKPCGTAAPGGVYRIDLGDRVA